jgi:hypothetical protein
MACKKKRCQKSLVGLSTCDLHFVCGGLFSPSGEDSNNFCTVLVIQNCGGKIVSCTWRMLSVEIELPSLLND